MEEEMHFEILGLHGFQNAFPSGIYVNFKFDSFE